MGRFARWLGTRGPDDGAVPVSAWELRRRLLALQRPGSPWSVRPGGPERVDVVAEWHAQVGPSAYRFVVLIALEETHHEARTLDKLWESGPGESRYGQGGGSRRASGGRIERDGLKLRFIRETTFDTRTLKSLARDAPVDYRATVVAVLSASGSALRVRSRVVHVDGR